MRPSQRPQQFHMYLSRPFSHFGVCLGVVLLIFLRLHSVRFLSNAIS